MKHCNNDVANSKAQSLSFKCNKETGSKARSANWFAPRNAPCSL